ncbi:thioesterase II family protein [Streptomyces sp. NPDC052043]|uniref:thioesterase II family protein n=1 Tax=Streptomyces sp. NPDC052043 TaxID=3365684 RepID=UPI0037D5FFF4
MSDEQPVRLHCFAHSGEYGSAFDHWEQNVGPGVTPIPVLLPGYGARRSEPRVTTHEALLAEVLPLFTGPDTGPFALYGHGLGALAAFFVTRSLHEAGLPGPAFLAVGACPPPDVPCELPDARGTTDSELLALLDSKGAVPPQSDEGVLRRAMLPMLRAELELAHDLQEAACRPSTAGPLTTPLLVVSSQCNPLAPPEIADGWGRWTTGPARLRTVPGRHFFVRGRELPRLVGRACRVAGRLVQEPFPVG